MLQSRLHWPKTPVCIGHCNKAPSPRPRSLGRRQVDEMVTAHMLEKGRDNVAQCVQKGVLLVLHVMPVT